MRDIIVTIGIPGSGKSKFIRDVGLSSWTIEPDMERCRLSGPVLDSMGNLSINQRNEEEVWGRVQDLLRRKGENGELIVVDATNLNARIFSMYEKILSPFGYRFHYVSFLDEDFAICKARNEARVGEKRVPDKTMERMKARAEGLRVPNNWQEIRKEGMQEFLNLKKIDLSGYKKINHIGDIQGCYGPLMKFFTAYPWRDDEFYIFTGDYIDRGPDSDKVIKFLLDKLQYHKNLILLEGNHERYLKMWINGETIPAKNEFMVNTLSQLEAGGIEENKVRALTSQLKEIFCYRYMGRDVIVSHGGISNGKVPLRKISSRQLIYGVGGYNDLEDVAKSFLVNSEDNQYQVFGHRNIRRLASQLNDKCYVLEGGVEHEGGALRTLSLSVKGFVIKNIDNTDSLTLLKDVDLSGETLGITDKDVVVKECGNNVVSLSLSRKAQWGHRWENKTVVARGLFVDKQDGAVVARGYPKFFNIDEKPFTTKNELTKRLSFPVNVFKKENGYLGLVGYNKFNDELFVASKTTSESDFAKWFKIKFLEKIQGRESEIKNYLKNNNTGLIFEVILPQEDPHIVQYQKSDIVLLDIVTREVAFQHKDYSELCNFASEFGLTVKNLVTRINSGGELVKFIDSVNAIRPSIESPELEGYVLEDNYGSLVKIKTPSYWMWRHLRTQMDRIKAGGEGQVNPKFSKKIQTEFLEAFKKMNSDISLVEAREIWMAKNRDKGLV